MARGGKKGGGGGTSDPTQIKGNRKDNVLNGTAGDDTVLAGRGNDLVNAGAGNDFVMGDQGNDTLNGDADNDRLFGLDGNDIINGGTGDDWLDGGFGADEINGGDGNDYLTGSLGADTLDGGSYAGEYNIAAFDNLGGDGDPYAGIILTAGSELGRYTSTNEIAVGVTEVDELYNIHEVRGSNYDDIMTGGTHDDHFFGALGFDTIDGAAGADTIFGGLEDDLLTGGTGADLFVFVRQADGLVAPLDENGNPINPALYADNGTGDGIDTITDFEVGIDRLLFLSNEEFDFTAFTAEYIDDEDHTILTYQAGADIYGESYIVLKGVDATLAQLVSAETDLQVDINYDFMIA